MSLQLCYMIVGMLILFAIFDLVVGVTNDAVNFLNSAIGSKAAPFFIIMIIAGFGILAGVTFSGGMMEVARKGIFHPQFFTMPELLTIFLAVMITDILLLDLFNTHGLPTSTTVSIVFELLGAAVALSVIKIMAATDSAMALWDYIKTAKALAIVGGILLSIVIAFFSGAVMQFLSRLIFTFNYQQRLKKYGSCWGGVAMTAITFFILVKGSKGATFMDAEAIAWIKAHSWTIMAGIFAVSAIIFQVLISVFKINILKPIVLVGTFALAMAFAANDLVNFIGVPLAGLNAFQNALATADPLTVSMAALSKKVQSQTYIMLVAGIIMVVTLWLSKKARTVTETEIRLGQQDEGTEKFESIWLSRKIVNMFDSLFGTVRTVTPAVIRETIARRLTPVAEVKGSLQAEKPSFDLVRASVNLMVASAVVSYATSMKLPLSTTYVTFMVSMGSSFSDQAWGRESAVYRVTGVLTVIGGWFMTAFIAFVTSFIFASVISHFQMPGAVVLFALAGVIIWKNKQKHDDREKEKEDIKIFNMKKINDSHMAIMNTFEHLAHFLKEIRESFDVTFDALFEENVDLLAKERKKAKHVQLSANIIMANIFKVLRLQNKKDANISYKYAQTIRRLQKLSDGHRDTVARAYIHIGNKHSGLLDIQVEELKKIKICIMDILLKVETSFNKKEILNYQNIIDQYMYMRELADHFNQDQIERIRSEESKTRLSILFYAIVGNCLMMAKQNIKLLEIFNESFKFDKKLANSYIKLDSQ